MNDENNKKELVVPMSEYSLFTSSKLIGLNIKVIPFSKSSKGIPNIIEFKKTKNKDTYTVVAQYIETEPNVNSYEVTVTLKIVCPSAQFDPKVTAAWAELKQRLKLYVDVNDKNAGSKGYTDIGVVVDDTLHDYFVKYRGELDIGYIG